MSRILVIRGGAIGDFILTLPAIRLLRAAFPTAHLEILGYQHIIALAKLSGDADATRSIEYASLASFFSRDGDLAPALVEYFASFQQVVSYLFDPDEIFAANLKRAGVRHFLAGSPKITAGEHAARQLARPLEKLALYLQNPAAVISLPDPAPPARDLLAIHPGSGSATKNWAPDRFLTVARHWLAPNEKRRILLVGGEADGPRVAALRTVLPNDRLELAQHLSLPELARRLGGCGVFLGHDSGISHLAGAVGTKALLLFGPTDPAIWAPANPQVQVLRAREQTMNGLTVGPVCEALGALVSAGATS